MGLEVITCRLAGVNPEIQGIRWYSVAAFAALARLDEFLHHTTYGGELIPTSGPAIIVANHISMWDIAKGYRIGQRSHRILRTFTRASLLNASKQDPQRVLARTGHKADIFNRAPKWLKYFIAAFPKGVDAIPVPRGGSREAVEQALVVGSGKLSEGLAVAIFGQETRQKDGRLVNLMPGPAFFARKNPDVPIQVVRISQEPDRDRVSISKPFTYNQMRRDPELGDLARHHFDVLIGDRIADLRDDAVRADWYQTQRPLILTRRRHSRAA